MPKTASKSADKKPSQPTMTRDFPKDTASESVLVEIAGQIASAATSALRLSNDGRIAPDAQAAFWSIAQTSIIIVARIDDIWYRIVEVFKLGELRTFRDIADSANQACAGAADNPTAETMHQAYKALAAANDVIGGKLDKASA